MKVSIRICYARTTPESVDDGDFSETGIDEEFHVTDEDIDEGETIIDYLYRYADRNGFAGYSSSEWGAHSWYETGFYDINYSTGEEEQKTMHIEGLTDDDSKALYHRIIVK